MKLLLQARGRVFASCLVATLAFVSAASAKITVEGTPAQREKIANWLSGSLDAIVSIDAQGVMTVGSGGNASATRLRSMCDDATPTCLPGGCRRFRTWGWPRSRWCC
jgi:hypothetical protein